MSAELERLASVIDGYFKSSFLFDVYQSAWRQRVSPAPGTEEHSRLQRSSEDGGALVPPLVRFASITAKDDVQSAAKAVRLANGQSETMSAEELSEIVKAAVTSPFAKLITFVEDSAQGYCVRRLSMLSEDDNPIHRSVHMKPVHQLSTEAEIRAFVANHIVSNLLPTETLETVSERIITSVSKRSMVDVSETGVSRTVFFAQIEFAKKAFADLFVRAPPSYTVPEPLLQHYLPPLKVKILSEHIAEYEELEARREAKRNMHLFSKAVKAQEARQENQQVIEARLEQHAGASSSSATAEATPAATIQVTEQFLTPGKTLKINNLPSTVTWRDVKVKLSNLFPDEKRLIRVVKEHEGSAYVVLFSPEKVEPLLSAWAADTYCHNVVPSLVKVEGEEEKWAMEQYPSWVGGFVTKKVVKNAKFAAKRSRE